MATVNANVRWADNTAELKQRLMEGIGVIDAMKQSVDRTAASMGGQGLFQQANKLTAAIEQLGGVTKLTAAEQERASAVLDKAIEKYKIMGMTAPPAMIELRDAMKGANEASVGLGSSWVARIAEGLLLRDAIREVLHWMKDMITALPELAMRGSEVASVQHGFELLAGSTKNADAIMQAMRVGTKNTISDFDLMKDATHLLSAGVQLTANDFGTLTEAARVLAHRGFGDTTEILNKLSDALITGRTKTVAKMLGVVDAKGAELEYQTALGTGIDKLTAVGKAEAIREAVLSKLSGLVKSAGEQEVTFAERVAQAKTALGNFTDALGVAIATSPVVKTAMGTIEEAIAGAVGGNQVALVQTLTKHVNELVIFLVNLGIAATQVATVMVAGWGVVEVTIKGVLTAVLGAATGFLWLFEKIATGLASLTGDAQVAQQARQIGDLRVTLQGMTGDMASQTAEAGRMVAGTSAVNEKIDALGGGLLNLKDKLIAQQNETAKAADVLNALGAAHDKAKDTVAAHSKMLDGFKKQIEELSIDLRELSKYDAGVEVLQKKFGAAIQNVMEEAKVFGRTVPPVIMQAFEQILNAQALQERGKALIEVQKSIAQKMKSESDLENAEYVKNLGVQVTALEEANVLRAKDSLNSYDYQVALIRKEAQAKKDAIKPWAAGYKDALESIDQLTNLKMADAAQAYAVHIHEMEAATNSWANLTKNWLESIPGQLQKAFTGGGGISGAIQSLTSGIGSSLGEKLFSGGLGQSLTTGLTHALGGSLGKMGTMIGGMMPGIGSAIGAFAGPLIDMIMNIGGPSKDELAARDTFGQFQKQFGTLQQTIDAVGAAYAKAGKTGVEAQQALQRALDATHISAQAEKAALDEINNVLNAQKQDDADLTTAVQKYKFSIEELGPAMQKQQLDQQANQLMNDWRLLVASGIQLTTVNEHMASSVQDYLHQARVTGQEVPIAMQPIIKKMIDQGLLTDDAGTKITDLKDLGITFAESMTQGFNKIVDKLTELIQKISDTTGAINAIPSSKTITIDTVYTSSGGPSSGFLPGDQYGPNGNYASAGGIVTAAGIQYFGGGGSVLPFMPRGTDTVPAMLTPGEMVLTRKQQRAVFGGGAPAIDLSEFKAMRAELQALRGQLTAEARRTPERVAMAVAGALATTPGRRR